MRSSVENTSQCRHNDLNKMFAMNSKSMEVVVCLFVCFQDRLYHQNIRGETSFSKIQVNFIRKFLTVGWIINTAAIRRGSSKIKIVVVFNNNKSKEILLENVRKGRRVGVEERGGGIKVFKRVYSYLIKNLFYDRGG